jgi:NADPH:quinone reductase-like Zn-dependent oxidoreductase
MVRDTNYIGATAMHAAVVTSFTEPPHYRPFDDPVARGEHEEIVRVLAAGLHPRVRSQANGSHYTSTGELPLIPGIDGVGRTAGGELVYFVLTDTMWGSMAEQTVIGRRRSVRLAPEADVATIAAAMNPAMSSWVALRRRISFSPGQSVLILGATGNAGQMAVQVAKHLGASRVIAVGRDADRLALLAELGADETISLLGEDDAVDHDLGRAAASVDLVIDYTWGAPTERALPAILTRRDDDAQPLTWLQIGAIAGPSIELRSAWLRAARVDIVGSGQGSVPTSAIVAELPALAAEITAGTFAVSPVSTPLSRVQAAWSAPTVPGERIVITPN